MERKGNANGVVRYVEGDIRAVERAARAVVFSPGFVDSHFEFIAAGGGGDAAVLVVGDPMGLVAVVEFPVDREWVFPS